MQVVVLSVNRRHPSRKVWRDIDDGIESGPALWSLTCLWKEEILMRARHVRLRYVRERYVSGSIVRVQ